MDLKILAKTGRLAPFRYRRKLFRVSSGVFVEGSEKGLTKMEESQSECETLQFLPVVASIRPTSPGLQFPCIENDQGTTKSV